MGDKLKSLSRKIVGVLSLSLLFSFLTTNVFMYLNIYDQTLDSVGVEAYGCASITTALITTEEMELILDGDAEAAEILGNELDWTVDHKHIFRNQYILDLEGNVIVADNYTKEIGVDVGYKHPIDQETIDNIVNGKHEDYSDIYDFNNLETITGFAPIYKDQDPRNEVIAISAIDFPGQIVQDRTLNILFSSLIWNLVPLFAVLAISAFFTRRLIKPIEEVTENVKEVSNGDLTVVFDHKSNDEIGVLSENLNMLIDKFRDILSDVAMNTKTLAATSEELSASSQYISDISNRNTSDIENINNMSSEQLVHTDQINEIIVNLSNHIHSISKQLNDFANISKETVAESISGINTMNDTNLQMESIGNKIGSLTDTMVSLQHKSEQIDNIIHIINDIANQTNILSLNAAIEAARAGESGKGFAVVADEVRNLAEMSGESTENIRSLLNEIQSEIEEALTESKEGNEETQLGLAKTQEAGAIFHLISDKVKTANNDFIASSESVNEVSTELEEIVAKMKEVVALLSNTTENTNTVSSAINDQNNSFNEIVEVTHALAALSENLEEKIAYFKIKAK
ncbi:methyl-accepting chemotaxis protein [Oceanobacillus sp. CAU 1775]